MSASQIQPLKASFKGPAVVEGWGPLYRPVVAIALASAIATAILPAARLPSSDIPLSLQIFKTLACQRYPASRRYRLLERISDHS